MKAMILAAGLGTRLKPLTDHIPKALVEVKGVPMLERVILKLKDEGFDYIVVNVHHFSDQIINFLKKKNYGVEVLISEESNQLLDTGGGLVKASSLIFNNDDSPVLVHNVDIISNANLKELMHATGEECGTLLVSPRESSRQLIFDEEMNLAGWHDRKNEVFRWTNPKYIPLSDGNPSFKARELAFSGIYVVGKDHIKEMRKLLGEGKFGIMDYFLHQERKCNLKGVFKPDLKLIDIGKPATLSQASEGWV